MATTTPNLGLKKPNVTDKVNVSDLNGNADLLDAIIGRLSNLNTTQKDSLVAAINEALTSAGTAAEILQPEVNQLKSDLANLENLLIQIQDKLNQGTVVDHITVNEINDMIVSYFENKTVLEVEG